MTRLRRTVALAVTGTLAVGALMAGVLTTSAHAGITTYTRDAAAATGDQCQVQATSRPTCFLAESVRLPLSVSISVSSQPAHNATATWTISCARNGNATSVSGTASAMTPFNAKIALPRTNGADCSITANVTVNGQASMKAAFMYTLGHQITIDIPQGTNYSGQPIYAIRCLTDPGNNPARGTPAVIRGCEDLYSQTWTYRNGELIHGRYCLTDKGNGGMRTKLILYTCTGAADQRWTYRPSGPSAPDGAFVLKARGGRLCLDDPKTSTANNTQQIVYTCTGGNDQRWIMS